MESKLQSFKKDLRFFWNIFMQGCQHLNISSQKKNYPKMSQYIISRCLIKEVYECFQLKMCFSGALPTIRQINETAKIN